MDDNKITELSAVLKKHRVKTTKEISLCNSQLYIIPEEIYNYSNLEVLNLSYNNITLIPENLILKHLPNLKKILLSYNPINQLPINFFNLSKLELLNLENCSLESLTMEINDGDNNNQLKILNLSNNPNLFKNDNNLQILSSKLQNLKCLMLLNNELEKIPDFIFSCKNLEILNMNNNKLSDFIPILKLFIDNNLLRIKTLSLKNNKLDANITVFDYNLHISILEFIKKLQLLDIQNNDNSLIEMFNIIIKLHPNIQGRVLFQNKKIIKEINASD